MNAGFTTSTRVTLAWIRDNAPATRIDIQAGRHMESETGKSQVRKLLRAGYIAPVGVRKRQADQRAVLDDLFDITEAGRAYLASAIPSRYARSA